MSSRRRRYMQEFPQYDENERKIHLMIALRALTILILRRTIGPKVAAPGPKILKQIQK